MGTQPKRGKQAFHESKFTQQRFLNCGVSLTMERSANCRSTVHFSRKAFCIGLEMPMFCAANRGNSSSDTTDHHVSNDATGDGLDVF